MKKISRFFNCTLLRDHQIVRQDLWMAEGKIIPPQSHADIEIDVKNCLIAPGYIDLQINGGYGIDLATEPDRVGELAAQLPRHGVTAFLPTLISCAKESYPKNIATLKPRTGGAHSAAILGIHLEGPFLNPLMARAHDSRYIIPPDHWKEIYSVLEGVKIVTLAPELPGSMELIEFLNSLGIVVAAGHSAATDERMQTAVQKGLKMITHLYNAMAPFDHRQPGIVGAALAGTGLFYSLIADGRHVHPNALRLAWRANPQGLCLVSDAMQALGFPPGLYQLGVRQVEVNSHGAYIKGTQTLAGSIVGLDAAVRYFWKATGCSQACALEAASSIPAKILGLEKVKGTLESGADADLVLLNDQLEVLACYVNGHLALRMPPLY